MLLHLVAVSLMLMACASEALGATLNCTAVEEKIDACHRGPGQKKSFMQCYINWLNGNVAGVTTLLKKKKTSGCIKASMWPDIQAWIPLNTPPKAYLAITKSLSKAQKKTLVESAYDPTNKKLQKKVDAIKQVVNEKVNDLSEADKKEFAEWNMEYGKACGYI
uniref:Uncharacterized protein n=1 Tax=Plectus sambesii TaxID=2011161 RepID=A0A914W8L5_9BILA